MKTLKKDIPVLLAAVLFTVCGLLLLFAARFMTAFAYFLMAIVLLRRRKGAFAFFSLLAMGLLTAIRFSILWYIYDTLEIKGPLFQAHFTAALVFTAGMVLLYVLILLDGADSLKKYRVFTGPLWFVPGVVMLLASLIGTVLLMPMHLANDLGLSMSVISALLELTYFMCGPLEAVAALLLGRWLYVRAPEDLENYLKMREDGFITEAEFEERRQMLGLQKRTAGRAAPKDA